MSLQRIDFDLGTIELRALEIFPKLLLLSTARAPSAAPVLERLRSQLEAELDRRADGGSEPAKPLDLDLAGLGDEALREAFSEAIALCVAFVTVRTETPCAFSACARIAHALWAEAHARGIQHRLQGGKVLPWN